MKILTVPHFSQRDNASGNGYRECFSSSCAMIAAYYSKVNSDDEYNCIRGKYGDTIYAENQIATLQYLGLSPRFKTNGTLANIRRLINTGCPVAVGWLHHGSASAPSGGGHWSVVVGYSEDGTIHNDPYGEANLIEGGYLNSNGENQHYSHLNWLPRWMVGGVGNGWYLYCK